MLKFGRNYRMRIKIGKIVENAILWDEEIEIKYPITVNFQITRSAWSNVNTANFEFYNLSDDTRAKLYKDRYMTYKQIRVEFYAGYGSDTQNLPLCFAGEVFDGFSDKKGGDPNIKTTLTCGVGLFSRNMCAINQTFAAGTKPIDIIKTLCNAASLQLGNSESSVIAGLQPLSEDTSFVGYALRELDKYVDGNMYIDSSREIDKIWILGKNDVLPQMYSLVLNEKSIFGTPKRKNLCLYIDLMFEPRLMENQQVELFSETASYFNGQYKIVGFNHIGTISGAVGGNCQTTALLQIPEGTTFDYVMANKEVAQ